jgi:prepilin-type N-terminal cleavage/methylation domain-containing protein
MRKYLSSGFTLVELLIVIALLGVIATIVIAAINPIEQANRAADAGMKADASQLVSALQRYYVAHGGYPWNDASCPSGGQCINGLGQGPDTEFSWIGADDPGVGVCGVAPASCKSSATQGVLISALDLQGAFVNKSWVNSTNAKLWVGKASLASSGVFVCWSPKSQSNRQNLLNSVATGNKLFNVSSPTNFSASGLPTAGVAANCALSNAANWSNGTCVECVPE